jgi:hypothetical protein
LIELVATLPEHINACDERVNACDERHLCDPGRIAEEDVVVAFPSTDSLLKTRLQPPEFICITNLSANRLLLCLSHLRSPCIIILSVNFLSSSVPLCTL